MVEKKQFTLRFLLTETFVLAIGFCFVRLYLVGWSPSATGFETFLCAVSRPAACACFGGAFGGIFGRAYVGAMLGFCIFIFWLLCFGPVMIE